MSNLKISPKPVKYYVNAEGNLWEHYWVYLHCDRWLISSMEDDSWHGFQNMMHGYKNGFESEKEAFFMLELYINKRFDELVFYGDINRENEKLGE